MVLPSSGTITLQQIRNQWAASQAAYGGAMPGGFAAPSYNLLAYRGTAYYYEINVATSGSGTFPGGTITIETFYGKTAYPEWNCNCNCLDCTSNNC
jgi:hypothetical protein